MEWEKELKEIKDNSALWKLLWRVWEASDLIKRRYQIDAFDRGLMNDLIEHLKGLKTLPNEVIDNVYLLQIRNTFFDFTLDFMGPFRKYLENFEEQWEEWRILWVNSI